MKINLSKSPSFGCGACAAAYKKAAKLAKNPETLESIFPDKARKMTQKAIAVGEFLNPKKTHGQIASQYNKFLGERLNKLSVEA